MKHPTNVFVRLRGVLLLAAWATSGQLPPAVAATAESVAAQLARPVRVSVASGADLAAALDELEQQLAIPVTGCLPPRSQRLADRPVVLEGTAAEVLDGLAARLRQAWVVGGDALVLVRLAGPPSQVARSNEVVNAWLSLSPAVRRSLLASHLVARDALSAEFRELVPAPALGAGRPCVIGLTYDLDLLVADDTVLADPQAPRRTGEVVRLAESQGLAGGLLRRHNLPGGAGTAAWSPGDGPPAAPPRRQAAPELAPVVASGGAELASRVVVQPPQRALAVPSLARLLSPHLAASVVFDARLADHEVRVSGEPMLVADLARLALAALQCEYRLVDGVGFFAASTGPRLGFPVQAEADGLWWLAQQFSELLEEAAPVTAGALGLPPQQVRACTALRATDLPSERRQALGAECREHLLGSVSLQQRYGRLAEASPARLALRIVPRFSVNCLEILPSADGASGRVISVATRPLDCWQHQADEGSLPRLFLTDWEEQRPRWERALYANALAGETRVRWLAADGLARLRNRRYLPVLAGLQADQGAEVRAAAAAGLRQLSAPAGVVVDDLLRGPTRDRTSGLGLRRSADDVAELGRVLLGDDDQETRCAAARALGQGFEPASEQALRHAAADDPDPVVRAAASVAVYRRLDQPRIADVARWIRPGLASPDPGVASEVLRGLTELRRTVPAVPTEPFEVDAILTALEATRDPAVRAMAYRALARPGWRSLGEYLEIRFDSLATTAEQAAAASSLLWFAIADGRLRDYTLCSVPAAKGLARGYERCRDLNSTVLFPEHVVVGLMEEDGANAAVVLQHCGVTAGALTKAAAQCLVEYEQDPDIVANRQQLMARHGAQYAASIVAISRRQSQVLADARDLAAADGLRQVRSEHYLRALVAFEQKWGLGVLRRLGITPTSLAGALASGPLRDEGAL